MTIIVLKNMFDEDFWRRKEFLLSNSCSSWKQDQWYIITGYWLHFGSMHELFLFDLFSSWQASSAEEADPLVRLALWSHEQIKENNHCTKEWFSVSYWMCKLCLLEQIWPASDCKFLNVNWPKHSLFVHAL